MENTETNKTPSVKQNKNLLSFENILKIGIPLATFLGFIYLFFFYKNFKIPIYKFIELSEVINYFMLGLLLMLASLLINAIIYVLFFKHVVINEEWFLIPKKNHTSKKIMIFCCIALLSFIFFLIIIGCYKRPMGGIEFTFAFMFFAVLLAYLVKIRGDMTNNKIVTGFYFYCAFAIYIFIIISITFATSDSFFIKYKKQNFRTFIELKDSTTILCNDTLLYVGNVKNYFFLYDLPKGEPIIYKMDEVKAIHLRNEIPNR